MSGRRAIAPAPLLLGVLALVASTPGLAAQDGAPDPDYVVYAGCEATPGTPPSHFCRKGDRVGAFFRSRTRNVRYLVCKQYRPGGVRSCGPEESGPAEKTDIDILESRFRTPLTVTWRVGSQVIGSWKVKLYRRPVVPPFSVNPLIVLRSHRLFGLLVKPVGRGFRVRAWRGCPGECPLPLRPMPRRGDARRYRIEGSPEKSVFSLGDLLYVQVDAPWQRVGKRRMWGRLYRGKLVRDQRGGPRDTAIRQVGGLLCTPPNTNYRSAASCRRVPD